MGYMSSPHVVSWPPEPKQGGRTVSCIYERSYLSECPESLHRVAEVRREENVSLRTCARQLNTTVADVKQQLKVSTDLTIRQLRAWQGVLGVPLSELLEEPSTGLSEPIHCRAQLLKVMKTALSLRDAAKNEKALTLSNRLIELLLELMPELNEVNSWPSVGQRRGPEDCGRTAELLYSASRP